MSPAGGAGVLADTTEPLDVCSRVSASAGSGWVSGQLRRSCGSLWGGLPVSGSKPSEDSLRSSFPLTDWSAVLIVDCAHAEVSRPIGVILVTSRLAGIELFRCGLLPHVPRWGSRRPGGHDRALGCVLKGVRFRRLPQRGTWGRRPHRKSSIPAR